MAKYSLRKKLNTIKKSNNKKIKQQRKTHKNKNRNKQSKKNRKNLITTKLKHRKYQVMQKGGNEFGNWVGVPNPYNPTGFGWGHQPFSFKCPN
tara:strand:- start:1831 stop:2109 length:279 start_codon:yes stop_codon:yes gene_type:complete